MSHVTAAIVAGKTVTLLLGSLISYLSWKAYRRTGSQPLRSLAVGVGVVTAGAVLGGLVDLFVRTEELGLGPSEGSLLVGVLVNSLLTAVGFAIITYSLYGE